MRVIELVVSSETSGLFDIHKCYLLSVCVCVYIYIYICVCVHINGVDFWAILHLKLQYDEEAS